jgi:hypothetical protein
MAFCRHCHRFMVAYLNSLFMPLSLRVGTGRGRQGESYIVELPTTLDIQIDACSAAAPALLPRSRPKRRQEKPSRRFPCLIQRGQKAGPSNGIREATKAAPHPRPPHSLPVKEAGEGGARWLNGNRGQQRIWLGSEACLTLVRRAGGTDRPGWIKPVDFSSVRIVHSFTVGSDGAMRHQKKIRQ